MKQVNYSSKTTDTIADVISALFNGLFNVSAINIFISQINIAGYGGWTHQPQVYRYNVSVLRNNTYAFSNIALSGISVLKYDATTDTTMLNTYGTDHTTDKPGSGKNCVFHYMDIGA